LVIRASILPDVSPVLRRINADADSIAVAIPPRQIGLPTRWTMSCDGYHPEVPNTGDPR